MKLATHKAGKSFFSSGLVKQSFGVFLSINTQGDLWRHTARAFF